MAYVKGSLSLVYDEVESGITSWLYFSGDTLAQVLASGYISDATDRRMSVGDIVDLFLGTLTNFTGTTGGQTLGAASFGPTVGVSSRFTAQPTYARCMVGSVGAPVGTTPGAATLTLVALPMIGLSNTPRNLVHGGDATTNPWQRGTSVTTIGATNVYTADRFFMVAGAGSSATMTKTANTTVPGFGQAFVWGRGQSSGSVSTIILGQACESLDSIRAQGQVVTGSFWAAANTGFAAGVAGSNITFSIVQGFGTDQSVSALANGTWTSQSTVVSGLQALNTTTLTRYSFSGLVSATATQLGVLFQYTPTSTTATTAENVITEGIQLEVGGLTPFEHRPEQQELALCERFYWRLPEPGTSGTILAAGMVGGTNVVNFVLPLPVQMRAAPTVTVTQGSLGANVIGGYVALTSFGVSNVQTVNEISFIGLATAVSGQAAFLMSSSAATGRIEASADL